MRNDIAFWTVGDGLDNPLPEWARTTAVSASGDLYVPAEIAGDAGTIVLCAARDGEPSIAHRSHTLVPAAWMRLLYPDAVELLDLIERRIKDATARPLEPPQGARAPKRGLPHD